MSKLENTLANLAAIAKNIRDGKMIGFAGGYTYRVTFSAFGDFLPIISTRVEQAELSGTISGVPYEVTLDQSIPLSWDEIAALREDSLVIEGEVFDRLYDYFIDPTRGFDIMPYGIAKAREGDPVDWIYNRLAQEFDF